MAFSEQTIITSIELVANNNIQVRRETLVYKDDQVVGTTDNHRHTVTPGSDLSQEDPRVQAIAQLVWTPELTVKFTEEFVAAQAGERAKQQAALKELNDAAVKIAEMETSLKKRLETANAMEAEIIEKENIMNDALQRLLAVRTAVARLATLAPNVPPVVEQ